MKIFIEPHEDGAHLYLQNPENPTEIRKIATIYDSSPEIISLFQQAPEVAKQLRHIKEIVENYTGESVHELRQILFNN